MTRQYGRIYDTARVGRVGEIAYSVAWDATDPRNPGWYVVYTRPDGTSEDSVKVWHPPLPKRRDALKGVERVARAYARELDRAWRKRRGGRATRGDSCRSARTGRFVRC